MNMFPYDYNYVWKPMFIFTIPYTFSCNIFIIIIDSFSVLQSKLAPLYI